MFIYYVLPDGENYIGSNQNGKGAIYLPGEDGIFSFPTFDATNKSKMRNPFEYTKSWAGRYLNI